MAALSQFIGGDNLETIYIAQSAIAGANGSTVQIYSNSAWHSIIFNAKLTDTGNLCTLTPSTSSFSLTKGKYLLDIRMPSGMGAGGYNNGIWYTAMGFRLRDTSGNRIFKTPIYDFDRDIGPFVANDTYGFKLDATTNLNFQMWFLDAGLSTTNHFWASTNQRGTYNDGDINVFFGLNLTKVG